MPGRSFLILCVLFVSGCVSQAPVAVEPPPAYLLHLPGIGGARTHDRRLIQGMIDGGYTGQYEIDDWTDHEPGLPALLRQDRHAIEAQRLADKLTAVRLASPRRTIIVTAHSGGAGIVVWALEKLPPDVQVDRVILLASALSPGYDLSSALKHVRGRMYNFYSNHDVIVLETGTTLFGTIDGVKTPASGFTGFHKPETADAAAYQKLEQIPYDDSWLQWGNDGSHIGLMSKRFVTHVIAPLVTDPILARAGTD